MAAMTGTVDEPWQDKGRCSDPATAALASEKNYTLFSFRDKTLKFRAPRGLRRYLRVNKWNAGYIEVETEYEDGVEEEYIDLGPILRDLFIDSASFLSPIKKVEVRYA